MTTKGDAGMWFHAVDGECVRGHCDDAYLDSRGLLSTDIV